MKKIYVICFVTLLSLGSITEIKAEDELNSIIIEYGSSQQDVNDELKKIMDSDFGIINIDTKSLGQTSLTITTNRNSWDIFGLFTKKKTVSFNVVDTNKPKIIANDITIPLNKRLDLLENDFYGEDIIDGRTPLNIIYNGINIYEEGTYKVTLDTYDNNRNHTTKDINVIVSKELPLLEESFNFSEGMDRSNILFRNTKVKVSDDIPSETINYYEQLFYSYPEDMTNSICNLELISTSLDEELNLKLDNIFDSIYIGGTGYIDINKKNEEQLKNIILHSYSNAFNKILYSKEFKLIMDEEQNNILKRPYITTYTPSDYFTDIYQIYMTDECKLMTLTPKTYDFFMKNGIFKQQ